MALTETLKAIANQADSAAALSVYSELEGTPLAYCEALSRTVEDLLGEIRSKLAE
mgnify:FL=1